MTEGKNPHIRKINKTTRVCLRHVGLKDCNLKAPLVEGKCQFG